MADSILHVRSHYGVSMQTGGSVRGCDSSSADVASPLTPGQKCCGGRWIFQLVSLLREKDSGEALSVCAGTVLSGLTEAEPNLEPADSTAEAAGRVKESR